MSEPDNLYTALAAAYVRGTLGHVVPDDDTAAIAFGREEGLRLHRFKRTMDLARVRAVIGALRGIGPQSLLDTGTGRGAFLWPLLDAFSGLPVTAVDLLDHRVEMLEAVRRGGIGQLSVNKMDIGALAFEDGAFDVACALEVLEHLEAPARAAAELVRVARRFVIASVPSKADDNPEHIQLFDQASLTRLFDEAGARTTNISFVRGHMICVAAL